MAQLIAATKITKEFKMFKGAATWLIKIRETVVSSNFITEKVTRNQGQLACCLGQAAVGLGQIKKVKGLAIKVVAGLVAYLLLRFESVRNLITLTELATEVKATRATEAAGLMVVNVVVAMMVLAASQGLLIVLVAPSMVEFTTAPK